MSETDVRERIEERLDGLAAAYTNRTYAGELVAAVRAALAVADHFKSTQHGYDGWTDGHEIEAAIAEALEIEAKP